jgi:hypothetical protein
MLSSGPTLWALNEGLAPDPTRREGPIEVDRDRLLARRMIVNAATEYSVADVIRTTSNVIGGVHAGMAKDERLGVLAKVNNVQIGGVSVAVRALPPIARVVGPERLR